MTKLHLTAFIYEDHLTPTGLLPREEKEYASAMWHFAKLAHQVLEKVPSQTTYEGEKDQTVHLRRIADSVKTLYNLKSMDRMMSFVDFVQAEAIRSGLPWDDRLSAFVNSGGTSYGVLTRDPDKVMH
jgi:hypothetical protein